MTPIRVKPGYLVGLQVGEIIRVNAMGMILRDSQLSSLEERGHDDKRMITTSSSDMEPGDLVYIAAVVEEFLVALGQPFGLMYVRAVDKLGYPVAPELEACIRTSIEASWMSGEDAAPPIEISNEDLHRLGYFELIYRVESRPL